jgi:hypothetical protein
MFRLLRDLLSIIFGAIEVLLVFRFVLRLLSANPNTPFVAWIYETSVQFIRPFTAIFPNPSIRGGFAIEFTTLFAIFAYAVIGYILQEVFDAMSKKGL